MLTLRSLRRPLLSLLARPLEATLMTHKEWLQAIFNEINNRDPVLLSEVIDSVKNRGQP